MTKEITPYIPKHLREENEFLDKKLQKGKYDIDYVLTLLKMIHLKCHEMRMNPRNLQTTLQDGCLRLIANIETERDNPKY